MGGLRRRARPPDAERPAQLLTARVVRRRRRALGVRDRLFGLLTLLERRRRLVADERAAAPPDDGELRGRRRAPLAALRWPRSVAVAARRRSGRGSDAQPLRPRARLLRQPRSRRHLHGPGARLLRARRGSTSTRGALGPLGADQAGRRGPGRPGDLLRARGHLARDQGLDVVAVAALVHEPLTSLISLPEARDLRRPRDLEGKTDRHRGDPVPGGLSRDDPGARGADARRRREVNVGLNLLPALLAGHADAILGGFRNIEGVDLAERGENPRRRPRGRARRSRPTTSWCWSPTRTRLEDDPEETRAVHRRARARHADAVADPEGATETCSRR